MTQKSLGRQLLAVFAEDGERGDVVKFARLTFLAARPPPHPFRPS